VKLTVFWFRRDLRLEDNTALHHALLSGLPVLPIFIFDENILYELPVDDARVSFIYEQLSKINSQLKNYNGSLLILKGKPMDAWKKLIDDYDISKVYLNRDYEPYALERDNAVKAFLAEKNIELLSFKDQVVFEKDDILKSDGKPYTVYTPYKNKWLEKFKKIDANPLKASSFNNFHQFESTFPSLHEIGFKSSSIKVKNFQLSNLGNYNSTRNYPALDSTSYLSPHLRFGTISIRQVIKQLSSSDSVFLSELIWREFFMQVLYHFPHVVDQSFKPKYDNIRWQNNESEFEAWCNGETGYPLVDAGMRELNATGYMHNRVRMVVASFLCKHLLIDWRWGEAYFAKKLLDYELSSNNGNWQWAAGTGCDAAPYFRIFNPTEQLKKFDNRLEYVKKWVPEFDSFSYPQPIVEHKFARERALIAYKTAL
jgi:deoxyribodipyrimidine photo-lyase